MTEQITTGNCKGYFCPLRIYRLLSMIAALGVIVSPLGTGQRDVYNIVLFFIVGVIIFVGSNIVARVLDILAEDRPPILAAIVGSALLIGIWLLASHKSGRFVIAIIVVGILFIIFYQFLREKGGR